jgi:hypothetical protein
LWWRTREQFKMLEKKVNSAKEELRKEQEDNK